MSLASYEIHPRIGVARLGNSPSAFYLAPNEIGGLPLPCDDNGNVTADSNPHTRKFKDSVGRVKRQAARFRILKREGERLTEVKLGRDNVRAIRWSVHIANKKPIWYTFSELLGCTDFGPSNSYANQHVPLNNPDTQGEQRKQLMIDPGPRQISCPGDKIKISRYNIPEEYSGSFPPSSAGGQQIDILGELRMDDAGRLIALPGLGNVTGSAEITSFRGASGYWDDIADGYVACDIELDDGTLISTDHPAWLLIGSPKYAPELVNITTLWDTMFDTAIRSDLRSRPDIYDGVERPGVFPTHNGYTPLLGFNPDYVVNFSRDIKPIVERMQGYRWVADIPYLADFAQPGFDMRDNSEANKARRKRYFEMFRIPLPAKYYDEWANKFNNGPCDLFDTTTGLPLLPLNSGDNSVTNSGPIYKFETLSATQYFYLYQWSEGRFTNDEPPESPICEQLDQADVGNCVGAPFSPGIETTWITRSPELYYDIAALQTAHGNTASELARYYRENGLSTTRNEADGGGLEPGDLTKRMAIPWQADFSQCTVQTPNISDPSINQFADGTGIEVPPTYYVYWWPPQSPMHVVTGSLSPDDQVLDALVSQIDGQPVIPAGQRVPYQRGIESAADVIANWSRLGFIINSGSDEVPYFVETERNNQAIVQEKISAGATLKAPMSGK